MRLLFRLLLAVVFLIALAIGAIFLLPGERLAVVATDQISRATGREVVLTGDISPSLYPQLGVTTGPVRVAGADWAGQPDLVRAESLAVGVDLMALLRGRIDVSKAEFVSPVIYLERAADGRVNWSVEGASDASSDTEGSVAREVSFNGITVSDAQITWKDAQAGQLFEVSGADIAVQPKGAGIAVQAKGRLNGEAFAASADLGDVAALMAGSMAAVDVDATLAGASVQFAGQASQAGQAKGRLSLATPNLDGPLRALGQAPVTLPPQLRGDIAVSGSLSANSSEVSIAEGRYVIGPFSAQGPVTVALADRVRVTGSLSMGGLDLSPFTGGSGGGGGGASDGWSTAAIDASGLAAVDADISVRADSIDVGVTKLGATALRAALDTGRLVTTLERTQAFGAPISGEFVVNSRGGLSMRANLAGQGLNIKQVLSEFAGFERLSGSGALNVSLLTSGSSVAQMMSGLDGTLSLSVQDGELSGIDLEALLQGQPANGGTTIIKGLDAPFNVVDGVMLSDSVTLQTPVVSTLTKGQINLGGRSLDLTTRRTRDGAERGVPVRVEGPWSSPRIYPDLEAVAREELEEKLAAEKARVEERIAQEKARAEERIAQEKARLEQQVQDKVAEELGVEVQEGQTLEEAAKSKLEEELKRGLGNLLGNN